MKIKRIEFIPGAGVNITVTKTRTLYDESGNPVVIDERDEPMAIGINDFAADPRNPTPADHELARQKISQKLAELLTVDDADLVAQNAVLAAKVENERKAKDTLRQEVETVKAERSKIEQDLAAERAAHLNTTDALSAAHAARQHAEVQRDEARNQLLQPVQPEDDRRAVNTGKPSVALDANAV